MAPEQAMGKNIAAPCDIYALGVIAYEALAGHPPFDGRTLAEVVCMHMMGEAPALRDPVRRAVELCNLVHRMLDKDPSLRPGAVEVRQLARAIAVAFAAVPTEELAAFRPAAARSHSVTAAATNEVIVVDPDELEAGVTEMLPVVHKLRWTPDIEPVAIPAALAEPREVRTRARRARTTSARSSSSTSAGPCRRRASARAVIRRAGTARRSHDVVRAHGVFLRTPGNAGVWAGGREARRCLCRSCRLPGETQCRPTVTELAPPG